MKIVVVDFDLLCFENYVGLILLTISCLDTYNSVIVLIAHCFQNQTEIMVSIFLLYVFFMLNFSICIREA